MSEDLQPIPLGPSSQEPAPEPAPAKEIMPASPEESEKESLPPLSLLSVMNPDPAVTERVREYVAPRQAAISIIPKREFTLRAPDPYQAFEVTFWVNPSDAEIQARLGSSGNWADYLAHFMLRWNLRYEPEEGAIEGEMVPITGDGIRMLPKELFDWMFAAFGEARVRPLVTPKDDNTGKNRTPTPANSNRNQSLNGSTA